jgi:peptide-methionine (S)-S-oxide reductase
MKKATFGSGCFWCTEAIFKQLKGVSKATSGYMGGKISNPTYREVCSGLTGHAEVVQVEYDPEEIEYETLLKIFWRTHDPTTLNQQGADVGTQYRSAVFYHDEEQKAKAENVMQALDGSGAFENPIVTEITKASVFYPAEDYHQNYFEKNPDQAYCQAVVRPKVEKFEKAFTEMIN